MQTDSFRAPRWLSNRHLQTLGAALPLWAPPSSFSTPAGERVSFPLPASANALVGRAWWQGASKPLPTVILIHGVGGSSESKYMLRGAVALFRAGFHVVRLNMRGAGEGVTAATSLYHAAMTGDVRAVVDALSNDSRVAHVSVVGFSLGGNLALMFAGELGEALPPKLHRVASISAPTDIPAVADELERHRTFPYRTYVVRNLVRNAREFAKHNAAHVAFDVESLRQVRTIREYDTKVIVPMHGFASCREYYEQASSGPYLHKIRVPTLMVHAEDDPMVPGRTVAPSLRGLPDSVQVAWSKSGGHVGWIGGIQESSWVNTWAMDRVLSFLSVA